MNYFSNKSLGVKFLILVIGIMLITMGFLTYYYTRAQQEELLQDLMVKTKTLGHFVSLITPGAILAYDFETMNNYMKEASTQEDIVYSILVSANNANLTNHLNNNDYYVKKAIEEINNKNIKEIIKNINKNSSIIKMSFPIIHNNTNLGELRIGVSRDNIDRNYQQSIIKILLSISGILILLSISIYAGFRIMVIQPINFLKKGLHLLARGKLGNQIHVQCNDEIGSLTASFNEMSRQLKESTDEKDVTALKLQQQAETLHKLNIESNKANEAKSTFLANMSHELRTPLNAVIGYSEMLDDEIQRDGHTSSREDLLNINNAGKHLLELINGVLDISKIEAGKTELRLEEFDFEALINEVNATIFPLIEKNKNTLNIDIKNTLGIIYADITKVRQILFNILNNACKFTANGTITLTAEKITTKHTEWVEINIQDTGIGIEEKNINKLFLPFSQIDNSNTRRFEGTGLGLAICKRFSEIMGGDITLQSQVDIGSIFTIQLPTIVKDTTPSSDIDNQ